MIVAVNNGRGLNPQSVMLTHQLYRERIDEILAEHPDATEITVIPIRSSEYRNVWQR